VIFNDSLSALDSVTQICLNYYYFSNKSPIDNSKSSNKLYILKSQTSLPCTLSIAFYGASSNIRQILSCDSFSTYFNGASYTNFFSADSIFLDWSFPVLIKRKAINARKESTIDEHIRISISSNGNRDDLYLSKPNILLSDNILNRSFNRMDVKIPTGGSMLNLNIKSRKCFKTAYNINGEILRDIPKDKIFIVKNY
jgi:hypothetical protein